MTSGKKWIIYYGPASHGRGLVDSCSAFGVKTPLRKEIINKDFYWTKSSQLVDLFQKKGMDGRYHYNEITQEDINDQEWAGEFPIKGSRKLHCIVFKPDGTVETTRHICDCDACFEGELAHCYYKDSNPADKVDEEASDDESYEEDEEEDDEEDMQIDVADAISLGTVIALRTPPPVYF